MFCSSNWAEAKGSIQANVTKKTHICENDEEADALTKGLMNAVKKKHSAIAHLFYRGYGLRFQKTEGDLCLWVMWKFYQEEGIVLMPVHDELAVPARHQRRARRLMELWLRRHNLDIPIDVETGKTETEEEKEEEEPQEHPLGEGYSFPFSPSSSLGLLEQSPDPRGEPPRPPPKAFQRTQFHKPHPRTPGTGSGVG
jgi:hypothetical protein